MIGLMFYTTNNLGNVKLFKAISYWDKAKKRKTYDEESFS